MGNTWARCGLGMAATFSNEKQVAIETKDGISTRGNQTGDEILEFHRLPPGRDCIVASAFLPA